MFRRVLALLAAPLLLLGLTAGLSGCRVDRSAAAGGRVSVVASFYPLQYAVEQIGGAHVSATSLTPPGSEPHDLELTPREVVSVAKAQLVVYADGFQPAVDSAVQQAPSGADLDVAKAADLSLSLDDVTTVGSSGAGTSEHESGHESSVHESSGHESSGHDESGHNTDPHFWLDPVRYAQVATVIADRLSTIDPTHRADYQAGLTAFTGKLNALNHDFATGLRTCSIRAIVTGHAAFGYLSARYHLQQVGVLGLTPDQEPTPGRLRDVASYVKEHHVTTIYTETLASPAVAQAVARQTGARVATLDPIEGITEASAAKDYFGIMRANLAALRTGQDCS